MLTILRDSNGNIKSYAQSPLDDSNLVLGEWTETIQTTMEDYADRFRLSVVGVAGQYFSCKATGVEVIVSVQTSLSIPSVELDINGLIETIDLTNGQAYLRLSTETPGLFILQPADRQLFCAAGVGLLTVEVTPNE
ncbi:MAG TPA: hypothetical protein PLV27_02560 [Anaerolineaceae bacterium]|nr:hypothetical protein [Anaerolineaceae bacterium]